MNIISCLLSPQMSTFSCSVSAKDFIFYFTEKTETTRNYANSNHQNLCPYIETSFLLLWMNFHIQLHLSPGPLDISPSTHVLSLPPKIPLQLCSISLPAFWQTAWKTIYASPPSLLQSDFRPHCCIAPPLQYSIVPTTLLSRSLMTSLNAMLKSSYSYGSYFAWVTIPSSLICSCHLAFRSPYSPGFIFFNWLSFSNSFASFQLLWRPLCTSRRHMSFKKESL